MMGPTNRIRKQKPLSPPKKVKRKPLLLSAFATGIVSLILAVVIGYNKGQNSNVEETTGTGTATTIVSKHGTHSPNRSSSSFVPVINKAKQAEEVAWADPTSTAKAQAAAEALFVEGQIRYSAFWNMEAVRRQARSNGATRVRFVDRYSVLHLVQHLEVNAILWARILLQLGPPYARQLEARCGADNQLSNAIHNDPTIVPRSLVTKLLSKCVIADDALVLDSMSAPAVSMNNLTVAHLLAHFGETSLISYAKTALLHLNWETNDSNGRGPAMIAAARGFSEAAVLLGGIDTAKVAPPPPRTAIASSEGDTGGWGGSARLGSGACEIQVVDFAVTTDAKMRELMSNEVPLLVRNGTSSKFSSLRRLLEKTAFVRSYGLMATSVGEVPYQRPRSTTIGSYVELLEGETTEYLFQSLPLGHPLRNEIEQHFPTWAGPSYPEERQVQLAIGPKGSGAPPHYHKAAVNTLFYGHKKWFLFPPKDAIYSSSSSASWVNRGLAESRLAGRTIYECEQRPGEVLFIPDFWGHATLNLEPSVAVASEFMTPRMEFEIKS
jgi:JmjC domain, hydroxylase